MYPRLELLRELLSEDGSIWVSIDDNEGHYLKVIMDEIFGRKNFISSVVWVKTSSIHNITMLIISHPQTIISMFMPGTLKNANLIVSLAALAMQRIIQILTMIIVESGLQALYT